MKPKEREEARLLRRKYGLPMKQIAARLRVSPASVHLWTSDIRISSEQARRNKLEAGLLRGAAWADKNRARRLAYQCEGRTRAGRCEPLHLAGCMLYWAEGSKERNCAKLANSDINMVWLFRRFLSQCFDISADRFTMKLNVYLGNGLSIAAIERRWLKALDLPSSTVRKHVINHFPTSSSGMKKNRLPYGVCTVSVSDTRIVQHIFGAIQEYAGFDEPRWLDCDPVKRADSTTR